MTRYESLLLAAAVLGTAAAFADADLMRPVYTVPGEMALLTKYGHVQGATCSDTHVYLACSEALFKLDWNGRLVASTDKVTPHLGDIAYWQGHVYGVFGLWDAKPGTSRLNIGMWKADDLSSVAQRPVDYPGARYLDGCIVKDGTLYTAVEHYGEGRFGHPPHRECTIMKVSVPDLRQLSTTEVFFDYPIHFGVQCFGTDGTNILAANYGASRSEGNAKDLNFSRLTSDLKLVDSQAFHASEGFCLVPPSVSKRREPVFFNVNALGGNMQGWWKDPEGNPARIRLDFFAYDAKTGAMRNITDYARGAGAPETIFISNDRPATIEASDWKEGRDQWPSVTLPSEQVERDWRGYDRLAVDFVCDGGEGGQQLQCYLAGPEGRVMTGLYRSRHALPDRGFVRWEIPLCDWQTAKGTKPTDVTRLHFFLTRPKAVRLKFYRATLLPKGAACPAPAKEFVEKVIRPMLVRMYADADCGEPPAVRTAAEIEAAQRNLVELKRRRTRTGTASAFRKACAAAGQQGAFCLATATSMENLRPRDSALPLPASGLQVRLARGERESVQLFVMPRQGTLRNVRVSVSFDGPEFPSERIHVGVLGYVNVSNEPPYACGYNERTTAAPGYVRKSRRCETGWWPDPILDYLDATDVAADDLQGFWLRVSAPTNQRAGTFRGLVTVRADGVSPVSLPLAVRVDPFVLPATPMLPLAVTFGPTATTQWEPPAGLEAARSRWADPLSPLRQWWPNKRIWCDFLSDYYLSFDNLYRTDEEFPEFDLLLRQRERGLNGKFNLGYWRVPDEGEPGKRRWREETLGRLKKAYETAKRLGMLDRAYVYGCDEATTNTFERIRWAAGELKAALPGVAISTTAYDPAYGVGSPLADIDWFTPVTEKFDPAQASRARKAGHQVWWYFACDQQAPAANSFIECPAIEMRSVMGAQAAKYRPDGFLYYETTLWNSVRPISGGPFTDADARSWTTHHGDGAWIACGPGGTPLSTVRLENFRDGLEDFAYVKLLEKRLAEEPDAPWAARARELVSVPSRVVESVRNYSEDPNVLYGWRNEMADIIGR